jgi:Secretion system C-terminal sorting domain
MKNALLTFVFFIYCCSSAVAGARSRVDAYESPLKDPNSPTSSSAFKRSKGGVSQVAYFNLKPTATRPTIQTRSTAISITESDFLALIQPNMRQETKRATLGTASVVMDIGTADNLNPQTWTIPAGTLPLLTKNQNLDFVAIADVPVAARVTGATHVAKRAFIDPDDGHDLVEYYHYKMIAGDELAEMGMTFIDTDDGDTVADRSESAQIFSDSPLDLGDNFTNQMTDYLDDGDLPKVVTSSDITVDAFGTINNPFGTSPATYNCLRMSLTITEASYTTNPNTPSSTSTNYFVAWVTKEGFCFYAKKPTQNASEAGVTLTNLEMMRIFPSTALAVELIDFQGIATKEGVNLTWTTANEKNNAGFDVERSADGKTFEKIGFVKGNGTTNLRQSYAFTNNDPLSILTYYRLHQVDFDGTSTTSNVISIEQKGSGKGLKVYPNPSFDNQVSIELSENTIEARNSNAFEKDVSVTNVLGQVIFQQKTIGQNSLQLDISTWEKGVYFVKTMDETVKFVKN